MSTDYRSRLKTFYDGWQELFVEVQPAPTHIWNNDETGLNPKGQRVQAAWVCNRAPPDSWYAATDSSFIQGSGYLSFMKKFKEFIDNSGLNDGEPHVLFLYGHASHVTIDVLKQPRPPRRVQHPCERPLHHRPAREHGVLWCVPPGESGRCARQSSGARRA